MANKPSVDGFIPRRSPGRIGEHHLPNRRISQPPVNHVGLQRRRTPETNNNEAATTNALAPSQYGLTREQGLTRSDVDDSLREIDANQAADSAPRKRSPFHASRRKLIKRIVLALIIIGILIAGWIGVKTLLASNSVFKGDIFGLIQSTPLKEDMSGRSNILIFGTSEDDEGGDHPGAFLTDSIMVLSVDQDKKDAFMVSIPRDLWVEYGTACNSGYQGKINELYGCFSDNGDNAEAGAVALAKKVGEVTGLDVQYQVHVNYTVVRESVDAVGGVSVKVESSDPRGILDRNFDWKCNYKCYYVKYANGEVAKMDGEHALAFMRARNAQGGYGLPGGNFDREKNQQKVIVALRDKALSAGTLANPAKVTGLIDAMGSNLNTNFGTNEIRTLMTIATEVKASSITSISLVDDEEPVMTTGNIDGISIVRPVDGINDYTGIASYIRKQIIADPASKEGAKIVVLNGSGVTGAAQMAADKLAAMGLTIIDIDNAPEGDYPRRVVYQRDATTNPATRAKLTKLYGAAPLTGIERFGVGLEVDFVVVVGQADTQTE